LAGTSVLLFVNAPQKVFEVWHEGSFIKQVPIKGCMTSLPRKKVCFPTS